MKTFQLKLILILLLATVISTVWGQSGATKPSRDDGAIVITGARFTYPLIQSWIDQYNQTNPLAQIVIEARGSADPASYDILVEAYEPDEATKKAREYAYVARYPILPVANSASAFASYYSDRGLTTELINRLYFHDLFEDKDKSAKIVGNYTVYNRLQKAGAPIVFTKYFGYAQKDIRGKSIAGADEHLLKALLRDSIGISYLPLTTIYDHTTHHIVKGLTVLPVDLDGNGKVGSDEKFYSELPFVVQHFDEKENKDFSNLPIGYIHLSVPKTSSRKEAIAFIQWVITNGQKDLAVFGYLKPEGSKLEKEKSDFFISRNAN